MIFKKLIVVEKLVVRHNIMEDTIQKPNTDSSDSWFILRLDFSNDGCTFHIKKYECSCDGGEWELIITAPTKKYKFDKDSVGNDRIELVHDCLSLSLVYEDYKR